MGGVRRDMQGKVRDEKRVRSCGSTWPTLWADTSSQREGFTAILSIPS